MMQLDYEAMSGRDLKKYLGPIITHPFEKSPTDIQPQSGHPRYLVEPADLELLESTFRSGVVAIIGFGQASLAQQNPQLQRFDLRYAAPEMFITRKRDGHASDIWSLACTIYNIRTQGQLLGSISSISDLLGFLGWAFGPIPSPMRSGVEDLLPRGSIIQELGEKDRFVLRAGTDKPEDSKKSDRHYLPKSWVKYRSELSSILSGHNSNTMSTLLPKDWRKWRRVRQQREKYTGYPTLLHEDLSRERIIYEKSLSVLGDEILDSSGDEDQQNEESDPPTPIGAWSPPTTPLSEWDPIEDIRRSEEEEYQGAFTQEELRLLDEMDRHRTVQAIGYRARLLEEWEDKYYPMKARLKEAVREQIDGLNLLTDVVGVSTSEHDKVHKKLMSLVRDRRLAKKAAREAAQAKEGQHIQEEGLEGESNKKESVLGGETLVDDLVSTQASKEVGPEGTATSTEKTPLKDEYDLLPEQELEGTPDKVGVIVDPEKPLSPAELLTTDAPDPSGTQEVRHGEGQHEIPSEVDGETTPRDTTWPKDIDSMRYHTRQQVSDEIQIGGKRPLAEIDWKQWTPSRKRPRVEYLIGRNVRDQVDSVELPDGGGKKTTYRLQKEEVDLLADLLNKMLKNDPRDRIGFPEVLKHKWFGDRWKCMVGSIYALHAARDWPG